MPKTLRTPAHAALMASLIDQRKFQSMTQQQLANALRRPQSYVAKIETGERRIDAVEVVEWALVLDTDLEILLRPVIIALQTTPKSD